MLRSIRKNAHNWMIKGVLWLIVAAFIGTIFLVWGHGGKVSKQDMAARVNDRVISMAQFYDEYQNLDRIYQKVYGKLLKQNKLDSSLIKKEALKTLIDRELLRESAETLNIRVSPEEVRGVIASNPAFQVNKAFSKDRYLAILRNSGTTPKDYEFQLGEELKLKKLETFIASSASISEQEVKDRYLSLKREVKVRYISLDPGKFSVKSPEKKDINEYYEKNRENFRTPPRVMVEYGIFSEAIFKGDITVSSEEVQTYYDANQEKYFAPEKRNVLEISIPYHGSGERKQALKKGGEIRQEILAGNYSFKEGMKKEGSSPVGRWYVEKDLPPLIAKEVFSLPVDSVTSPLDTGKAITLYKIREIQREKALPRPLIRKKVVEDIRSQKARDRAVIKVYEAKGKLAKKADFKKTLSSYHVPVKRTALLSPGEAKPPLSTLLSSAFLLPPGSPGEVKKAGASYYLYRVISRKESTILPLSKAKKKIVSILKRQKEKEATEQFAREIISKAKKGEKDLGKLSGKKGTVKSTPYFSPVSSSTIPGIGYSRDLARAVLSLGRQHAVTEKPLHYGDKVYVFFYGGEKKVSMKEYDTEKGKIRNALLQQKRENAIKAFIEEQRRKARIEIGKNLKI